MRLPGFTLIELVIYMAILGVVSAGVFSVYAFFLRHQLNARQTAELRSGADDASRLLRQHLASADKITRAGSGLQACIIATHLEFLERTGINLTSAEKVTASSFGGVGGSSSRSLGFWLLAPDQAGPETLLDFGADQPGRRWQVMLDASGRLTLDIGSSSIRGETSIRDGNWHHVMLVFDAASGTQLTPASLAIYINGEPERLTPGAGAPVAVDTDASVPMILGSRSTDPSFSGVLAAVKLWQKALPPGDIWPEVLSARAIDRLDLLLELVLETSLNDTSGANHSMAGPLPLSFITRHRSYARKTAFRFAEDRTDPNFHLLWWKSYMTGIRSAPADRCSTPSPEDGWKISGDQRWHLAEETPFILQDGMLEIRANIARKTAGRRLSLSASASILALSREEPAGLCQITPDMSGFETGGRPMAKAMIRIAPGQIEPDGDRLYVDESTATEHGPLQRIADGQPVTYFSYKDISASGTMIWGDITAEYVPATGVMTICTTSETHCGNADTRLRHPLASWGEVFRQVRYTSSRETYHPRKRFIFTLMDGTPPGTDHVLTQESMISPGKFFTQCP
ncbi:LamG-like jellyroll fold domain-containing protein [Alphaproteobacteria bacterium LSUCC0684]